MELPKYHETFNPILEVLSNQQIIHYTELQRKVRDLYYSTLPKELLEKKTTTGANILLDRIGWGKSSLKIGKYIEYPDRGTVKITVKGLRELKNGGVTLKKLHQDPDYQSYQLFKKDKEGIQSKETSVDNASPQDLIDAGFIAIETQIKNDLLERLKTIDPYYFEKVILILLKKMGYGDFIETTKSGDGGIDGIINEDKLGLEKIYIQAKRYNENKVREKEIRNFIGAMSGDTTKGIFVTTSTFDELAIQKAREAHHKIILVDGNKFVDLIHQYNVGVQVKNIYEMKEIDDDFFENN
jgi:restriction system protein